jgi:hypothetical protein
MSGTYIIYPKEDNGIAVLLPLSETMTIEEIAQRDVPAGVPYKIVSVDIFPKDETFEAAWEYDFSNPDGVAIGQLEWDMRRAASK